MRCRRVEPSTISVVSTGSPSTVTASVSSVGSRSAATATENTRSAGSVTVRSSRLLTVRRIS